MLSYVDLRLYGANWDHFISVTTGSDRKDPKVRPSLYIDWRSENMMRYRALYDKLYYRGLPKRVPRVEPYECSWYGETVLYPERFVND